MSEEARRELDRIYRVNPELKWGLKVRLSPEEIKNGDTEIQFTISDCITSVLFYMKESKLRMTLPPDFTKAIKTVKKRVEEQESKANAEYEAAVEVMKKHPEWEDRNYADEWLYAEVDIRGDAAEAKRAELIKEGKIFGPNNLEEDEVGVLEEEAADAAVAKSRTRRRRENFLKRLCNLSHERQYDINEVVALIEEADKYCDYIEALIDSGNPMGDIVVPEFKDYAALNPQPSEPKYR
jgi:hypothetical protein